MTAQVPPEAPGAGGDPGLLAAVVATSVGMSAMAVLAGALLRDALTRSPACWACRPKSAGDGVRCRDALRCSAGAQRVTCLLP